jgi:hypothetical protein
VSHIYFLFVVFCASMQCSHQDGSTYNIMYFKVCCYTWLSNSVWQCLQLAQHLLMISLSVVTDQLSYECIHIKSCVNSLDV